MAGRKEEISTFNLLIGEDTYASQDANSPNSARRLQSLIPALNGQLTRELGLTKYLPTQLPALAGSIFQYNYNDASGVRQSKQFVATSTALYMEVAGAWVLQTLPVAATGLNTTAPFADYPYFTVSNNLLHIADGTNSWLYDGPNAAFVVEGFAIPLHGPGVLSTAVAGNITAAVGKYYWYTFADETVGRVHESTSSPISVNFTGPITSKQVSVSAQNDTINTTLGSNIVVSVGAAFTTDFIGLALYVAGVFYGVFTGFTNTAHMTISANAPANNAGAVYLIAPVRATHIHWYGSETDGSKLGKFHQSMAVTAATPNLIDNSTFINQANSTILDIDRPFRNDPPPGSRMLELHKYRIFRVRNTQPNFFLYTANEEVASGENGSPQESTPGAASNTQSDIVNETSYPRQSNRIRALCSHNDALWIGTEKEMIPFYGQSIDDFGLSEIVSVGKGIAGRWAINSMPHGLGFISYDRKALLMANSPYANYVATQENVTDQLQEVGLRIRKRLKTIKASDLDNVRVLPYNFMDRDWWVLSFQDSNSVYHTWVYDFTIRQWFELQQGFTSLALFEVSPGNIVLVGGTADGYVYVVDDQTGTYTSALPCPAATFTTSLIDFGNPGETRMPEYLEIEFSNPDMADSLTLTFYLDPPDVDNLDPDTARTVDLVLVQNETRIFRAFFNKASGGKNQGTLCKRLLLNFSFASDANAGSIRGLTLKANPAAPLAL